MSQEWHVVFMSGDDYPCNPPPAGHVAASSWEPFTGAGNGVWWRQRLKPAREALEASGASQWAVAARRSARHGETAEQIEHAVIRCIESITGQGAKAERSATAARPILSLWKAIGYPQISHLAADLACVAQAAKECPDPLFARDIRAEGWDGGVDRSKSVTTICVQSRWTERLQVAQEWIRGGSKGRPRPAGGRGDAVLEEERDQMNKRYGSLF